MRRHRVNIKPEYSAQRRSHSPNPSLKSAVATLMLMNNRSDSLGTAADLGCGKLRHYELLASKTDLLYLIDTPAQLSRVHTDRGRYYTVMEVMKQEQGAGRRVQALSSDEFSLTRLSLDVVFCIAVFDVVSRKIRRMLTRAAAQNLSGQGYFVVIVPRNDSSILRRCSERNKYLDGHLFCHHGIATFFHNFRNYGSIVYDCAREGLYPVRDLSNYRQVCLVFGKSAGRAT